MYEETMAASWHKISCSEDKISLEAGIWKQGCSELLTEHIVICYLAWPIRDRRWVNYGT